MKKPYSAPRLRMVNIEKTDIICTSNPYGPDSDIIDFGGEGGEDLPAPPPSRARGMWDEW